MAREIIATDLAPQPDAPLSQAVRVGSLVFVSGITPFTKELTLAKDDFPAQMRQVMENLTLILAAAGSSVDRVVKCTVILARRGLARDERDLSSVLAGQGFPGPDRLRG